MGCLGWVQDNAPVLPVRYDRGLDRPAGGGKVDGTSAEQPPRLREHRLTKGADKILLGESGAGESSAQASAAEQRRTGS